jgi:ribosomal protein L7/L12
LKVIELIEQFKGLSLIELSEFVKAFEETFEVTSEGHTLVRENSRYLCPY